MRTVITSGYWNPLHVGHLDYLEAARALGDRLFVIVNNDAQVRLKGRVEFMPEADRMRLVSALRCVSLALLSVDEDGTVCKSLERLVSVDRVANEVLGGLAPKDDIFIFANGGDQTAETVPEMAICEKMGIEMVFGVGGDKVASSSDLIAKAA